MSCDQNHRENSTLEGLHPVFPGHEKAAGTKGFIAGYLEYCFCNGIFVTINVHRARFGKPGSSRFTEFGYSRDPIRDFVGARACKGHC